MRKANGGLPSGATTEVGGAAGVPYKSASMSWRAIAGARFEAEAALGRNSSLKVSRKEGVLQRLGQRG